MSITFDGEVDSVGARGLRGEFSLRFKDPSVQPS